jgi:hypothetical protein
MFSHPRKLHQRQLVLVASILIGVVITVIGVSLFCGSFESVRWDHLMQGNEKINETKEHFNGRRHLKQDKKKPKNKNPKKPKIGVYYYPWYGPNFHGNSGYPRRELIPPQYPLLGEYDDRQPNVTAQHIQWTVTSGVQVWATSWWGPGSSTDTTTLNHILKHPDIGKINIALFYETDGRIKQNLDGTWNTSRVVPDIQHIAQNYFGHPQYLKIGGKPVLFVYLTRSLFSRGILANVTNLMRTTASQSGYSLYIVGDHVWQSAPTTPTTYQPFQLLDGVTNYDVYGNLKTKGDLYARQSGVDKYQSRQMAWLQATKNSGRSCSFLPSVTPGFLKRGGTLDPMSRKLDENSPPGSLFRALLKNAFKVTDDRAENMVMITSFNEWHEETQIEPVNPIGGITNQPTSLTRNLAFDAYGSLYLDILKEEYSMASL